MKKSANLITASQIAECLNVSEHTVYRWCRSRKIPHFNLHNTYRFDPGEVQEWLESRHEGKTNGDADRRSAA